MTHATIARILRRKDINLSEVARQVGCDRSTLCRIRRKTMPQKPTTNTKLRIERVLEAYLAKKEARRGTL